MGQGHRSFPLGIEHVLAQAASDPTFARDLLDDRRTALEASGIPLTRTERAVLESLTEPLLAGMIAGLADNLVALERRAFLGKSTAVAALVLGGAPLSGCEDKKKPHAAKPGAKAGPEPNEEKPAEHRDPDRPPAKEPKPVPMSVEDRARARRERLNRIAREEGQRVHTLGVRPDNPLKKLEPSLLESGDPGTSIEKAFEGIGGVTPITGEEEGKGLREKLRKRNRRTPGPSR